VVYFDASPLCEFIPRIARLKRNSVLLIENRYEFPQDYNVQEPQARHPGSLRLNAVDWEAPSG
jgi:hypothetical protein